MKNGTIHLRAACAADNRETALAVALQRLTEQLQAGRTVEVVWPTAAQAAWAAAATGVSLAQQVILPFFTAPPEARLKVHLRNSALDEFLQLQPEPRALLVMHLNSEEAALRWERGDAPPGRRLAAMVRLRQAGWSVEAAVSNIRIFSGWRDDYADLAQRMAATGIQDFTLEFAGTCAREWELENEPDSAGTIAVLRADGCAWGVTARQRRDVQDLFTRIVHPGAARRAA